MRLPVLTTCEPYGLAMLSERACGLRHARATADERVPYALCRGCGQGSEVAGRLGLLDGAGERAEASRRSRFVGTGRRT